MSPREAGGARVDPEAWGHELEQACGGGGDSGGDDGAAAAAAAVSMSYNTSP